MRTARDNDAAIFKSYRSHGAPWSRNSHIVGRRSGPAPNDGSIHCRTSPPSRRPPVGFCSSDRAVSLAGWRRTG